MKSVCFFTQGEEWEPTLVPPVEFPMGFPCISIVAVVLLNIGVINEVDVETDLRTDLR